jgi:hypothetical protein
MKRRFSDTVVTVACTACSIVFMPISAQAMLLSNLINSNGSLTTNGVTFSAFDAQGLSSAEQEKVSVNIDPSNPSFPVLLIGANDPTSNPLAISGMPGKTIYIDYTVTSTGPISSVFSSATFTQNISGNSYFNDATVTTNEFGSNILDVVGNCFTLNAFFCGGLTSANFQNTPLGTSFDILETVNLQFSGSSLPSGYRIGVTDIAVGFGLNEVTVLSASPGASSPGDSAEFTFSDGGTFSFPAAVPEPISLVSFCAGLAGLVLAGRKRAGS